MRDLQSLDWVVKLRKERGLLPAVRLAGAFIMSSQGKQYAICNEHFESIRPAALRRWVELLGAI